MKTKLVTLVAQQAVVVFFPQSSVCLMILITLGKEWPSVFSLTPRICFSLPSLSYFHLVCKAWKMNSSAVQW